MPTKSGTSVIGFGCTTIGELWDKSLYDLALEAAAAAITDANIEYGHVDAVFYGNMLSGITENNLHATGRISEEFGNHLPVYRTEAACASGGIAFEMAHTYLAAHPEKTVLVLGAEKMTDFPIGVITAALSAAASGEEQIAGLTFPGLYGMLARVYLERYGYTEEALAHVAVKNHFHATYNPKAQFRKRITVEDVLTSQYVASPLKVLDSSPISDGAAAVVLTNRKDHTSGAAHAASIVSVASATDSISLKKRNHLDRLEATETAARRAFSNSGIQPGQIRVAEVHDCFTIAELLALEDLGFYSKGTAGSHLAAGELRLDAGGSLTVNTSGGLKASGHPVGATGIKQIGELYLQLTQQAGDRQVSGCQYALAHNVGGSGGTAVVTILGTR